MVKYDELQTVSVEQVVDEVARSLDPLAFENVDLEDMERRRKLVYARIYAGLKEYLRRECDSRDGPGCVSDLNMPW